LAYQAANSSRFVKGKGHDVDSRSGAAARACAELLRRSKLTLFGGQRWIASLRSQ
jgi:hypothetical protein